MFHFLKKFIPTLLIIVCIILLSVLNFSDVPVKPKMEGFDKLVHMAMYMGCSFVILIDLSRWADEKKRPLPVLALIAFLCATGIGGLLEIVQERYIPYRTGDWIDFIANTVGALIGTACGYIVVRYVFPHIKRLTRK